MGMVYDKHIHKIIVWKGEIKEKKILEGLKLNFLF
jgi:hypothetical protein